MTDFLVVTDLLGTLTYHKKEDLFKKALENMHIKTKLNIEKKQIFSLTEKFNYSMYRVFDYIVDRYKPNLSSQELMRYFTNELKKVIAEEVVKKFKDTYLELKMMDIKIILVSAAPYQEVIEHVIEELKKRGIFFDKIFAPKNMKEKVIMDKEGGKTKIWEQLNDYLLDYCKNKKYQVFILDDTPIFLEQAKKSIKAPSNIKTNFLLVGKDIKELKDVLSFIKPKA